MGGIAACRGFGLTFGLMTHDGLTLSVKQNLGHVNVKRTLVYIGTLDTDQRRPPAVYSFDLSLLPR